MESKQMLQAELKEVEKWEREQTDSWFWERIGRIPFKLLDKVTPDFIHEKIGALLDELGSFVQTGGKYLTQKSLVTKKFENIVTDRPISSIDDIKALRISTMDKVSEELKEGRGKFATFQGATTGFGGAFTLAADVTVLLGLSLKTLQEIAISYGYDPNSREERIFIVKCLQFASAGSSGKKSVLKELSSYFNENEKPQEVVSQIQGWREVVYTYRDQLGWKKLLQTVPVVGMVFGAWTNRSMIKDLAETGSMLYRKRRIVDRLKSMETEPVSTV
ncbi:EcsC family protein [Pseudalkalibacillus caeni]|uniref:EcsC family protein n=1 Tax=Exobacillus caeni TaxID=2574798 RepID=A0A5R9F8L2_9BACL|nr:EcsC family protein [Pseudalkalibacillus caeni]TLS36055.1 EcsC family protein [Pseudalkalibacillus caeni]